MFGFLKNLFGGIFAFFGRLLGLQKSEYVLEFESAPSATQGQPAKAQPAQAVAAQPKATEPAKAPAPAAKAQPKANTAKEAQPVAKPQAAKAVEPAKAPQYVGGFATNYSVPIATSTRRRPGANMNSFLDLARQVKSPK